MIHKLDNSDIVLLSRYVSGGRDERNITRVVASRLINKLAKFILRSKIQDLSSGIFIMKRKVLLDVVPVATGHGEFFVEFLYIHPTLINLIILFFFITRSIKSSISLNIIF